MGIQESKSLSNGVNQERSKAEILASVYKFANIGLSGREIGFAVKTEKGVELKPDIIKNWVHKARLKGTVRQLTSEEKKDIAATVTNVSVYTADVLERDMDSILRHIRRLESKKKPLPKNRLELVQFRIPFDIAASRGKGVKTGDKIIFENGTHLPSFKGHTQSESQKKAAKEANQGKSKSEEQLEKQSVVYNQLLPFIKRGLAVWEMQRLTEPDLTREQIRNAVYRKTRPSARCVPKEYFVDEKQRRSMGTRGGLKKNKDQQLSEEKNIIAFIREAITMKLFSQDISTWEELKKLYETNKRNLPESIFDKLRLEIYLKAMTLAENEINPLILNKYIDLMNRVGFIWPLTRLRGEEEFIKSKICKEWWADGEDPRGLFFIKEGMKKYKIGQDFAYVTSASMRNKRLIVQWRGGDSKKLK